MGYCPPVCCAYCCARSPTCFPYCCGLHVDYAKNSLNEHYEKRQKLMQSGSKSMKKSRGITDTDGNDTIGLKTVAPILEPDHTLALFTNVRRNTVGQCCEVEIGCVEYKQSTVPTHAMQYYWRIFCFALQCKMLKRARRGHGHTHGCRGIGSSSIRACCSGSRRGFDSARTAAEYRFPAAYFRVFSRPLVQQSCIHGHERLLPNGTLQAAKWDTKNLPESSNSCACCSRSRVPTVSLRNSARNY